MDSSQRPSLMELFASHLPEQQREELVKQEHQRQLAEMAKRDREKVEEQRGRPMTELEELTGAVAGHPLVEDESLLIHLAEELVEAAGEALRMAKLVKGKDPSDASANKVGSYLAEEIGDVENIYAVIRERMDVPAGFGRVKKMKRWLERLREAEG